MKDFIETRIIAAIRKLLTTRVNELLLDLEFHVPIIEFGSFGCGYAVSPVITLSSCEQSEKERIIRLDAYSLTIAFDLPDTAESELHCYTYSATVSKALKENPTLNGIAEKVTVTGKKYLPPKVKDCGGGWGIVLKVRIIVEEMVS